MLQEKDFFSYASIANSSNRFRKATYEYCVNNLTREKLLKSSRADATFFQLIEENKPTRALIRALNGVEGALQEIFSLSVARANDNEEDANAEARIGRYRKLVCVANVLYSFSCCLLYVFFNRAYWFLATCSRLGYSCVAKKESRLSIWAVSTHNGHAKSQRMLHGMH